MNLSEKCGAKDVMNAGAVMNAALGGGSIPAPSTRFRLECVGPKEHERQAYNAAVHRLALSRKFGTPAEQDQYARAVLAFELEPKWSEEVDNLVTTGGKTDIIDKYLKGSSYTAAWFLGLKGTGSAAAGDTLASHAGWTEQTPYSGNRPAITWGTTTSGSNTATAVSISITGSATVAGAFTCTVNTGSSGVLYSVSDFAASRTVANGDTLNVTPTLAVT
jgi:hypothetical protein